MIRAAIILLLCGSAHAVERYAVIAGNDLGNRDEITLRYAENDAQRLYDVLKDLGGFRPESMVLLKREDAATMRRAVIAMNERIRASNEESVLLVYYSGHADAGALHLGGTQLDLTEIEQLVKGSAATVRLLILDACRAGTITRMKGGRSRPPIAVDLEEHLGGEGAVVLAATAATEDAQESDDIKGSFFTHSLLSGLIGAADSDGDGKVTLEEAYRYAYDATLRASSRTLAGVQHPSFRYDLRGQGGLVLTRVGADLRKRGVLRLPEGRSYLVLAGSSEGSVVAEVGVDDRSRRVDLREGRYFIRGRARDHLVEGVIEISAGSERPLEDRELRRIEYARLVRKGMSPRVASHGPQVGYETRSGIVGGSSWCQGAYAAYPVELRRITITPRVGWCRAGFQNQYLSAALDSLDGEIGFSHSFDFPVVSFVIGTAAGASWLHEGFVTRGLAPARDSAALTIGGNFAIIFDLRRGFYLLADAAAQTYFFNQLHSDGTVSFDPAFAARISLGVGKHF